MTDQQNHRRRLIIDAAVEVIADVGAGRTTHRLIAERAGVPLGSTTYYFADLTALVTAGLERASELAREELRRWAARLEGCDDATTLARTLAELAHDYVADRRRATAGYELYLAAARHPELRPAARTWLDELHSIIAAHTASSSARSVVALLDGAMLHSLILDQPEASADIAPDILRLL